MKIVVTNNQALTKAQKDRLSSLGEVTYYETLPSASEYLERVKNADIICSGTAGLKDCYQQLRDVYVTVNYVSVSFLDLETLRSNNVTVSNAPGANRHAVSEWIIMMLLYLSRNAAKYINTEFNFRKDGGLPGLEDGLVDRNITILGNGNIGKRVAKIAQALDMKVTIFKRGDNLLDTVREADYIVDVLASNESTKSILNTEFFNNLKRGAKLVSVTRQEITDEAALFNALDTGKLSALASDAGGILVGDTKDKFYRKLLKHPKVVATPHISYNLQKSSEIGNDIMIDNVEAWINNSPQNVLN